MEPIRLSTQEAVVYVMLINIGIGALLGLIPLGLGIMKGNKKMGLLGLAASIAGGALLGVFLSIPAAAVFSWLVIRGSRRNTTAPAEGSDPAVNSELH